MKYLLLAALLTACGTENVSNVTGGSSLVGTWKSECLTAGDWSLVIKLTNTETASVFEQTAYFKNSCLSAAIRNTSQRSYVVSGNAIDFTYGKTERVYLLAAGVESANSIKAYGFSDWALNVAKDVSGLKETSAASAEFTVGENSYSIVKIEGESYLGGDHTSKTKEGRTTEYNTTTVLKKR